VFFFFFFFIGKGSIGLLRISFLSFLTLFFLASPSFFALSKGVV